MATELAEQLAQIVALAEVEKLPSGHGRQLMVPVSLYPAGHVEHPVEPALA